MILVFDIGTSVVKGGVFGMDGALKAKAEAPIKLLESEHTLHNESDTGCWISSLSLVTAQLEIRKEKDLDAIVLSGNGPTLVPVGSNGKPLDYAMTWMDRRAIEEAELIAEVSGFHIDPSFNLPKAYWIFRNKTQVYDKTEAFLSCPEYIGFFLTGNAWTILPSPPFTRIIWTPELVEKLGMSREKFPSFIRPGETMGKVRKRAEELTGIPAGVPVLAGGPDFIMALLGTATVYPGRVCERAGTSEGINLCSDKLIEDKRLLTLPHIIEGFYNISGIISTSGKALEWFKNITGREKLDYETMFEDICQVPSGSKGLLFLPYLAGERAPIWDPLARGAFVGLTLNHGMKEMTKAVVESVGYAIRDVIEVMEENGCAIEELRVTGSQAKSPLWNQIKADISGKQVLVPELSDSEIAGGLCIGLYSLGRYNSLAEASDSLVKIKKVYFPQPEARTVYDNLFKLYRESYRGLKNVFKRIPEIET